MNYYSIVLRRKQNDAPILNCSSKTSRLSSEKLISLWIGDGVASLNTEAFMVMPNAALEP